MPALMRCRAIAIAGSSKMTPGIPEMARRFGAPIANEYAPRLSFDRQRRQVALENDHPARIDCKYLRAFLMSCGLDGVSDVTIQSGRRPRVEFNGVLHSLAGKVWTPSEVDLALAELYRASNAMVEIRGQKVLDFAYDLTKADMTRQRFRVNATGIRARHGHGVEISIRILPTRTPTLAAVGLTAADMNDLCPRNGLVLIAGATGSGKSSTLAAIARFLLQADAPRKIIDLQAPVEFTYDDLGGSQNPSASIIGQSEIGNHLADFAQGVRSALRRNPDIIIVGEMRDRETMDATLEAALTGHLVFATVHASSIADCVGRVMATMSTHGAERRAYDLVSALRLVQIQYLVEDLRGQGRVAVRSWLRFNPGLRTELLETDRRRWPGILHDRLAGPSGSNDDQHRGKSLIDAVAELLEQGRISHDTARSLVALAGARKVVNAA